MQVTREMLADALGLAGVHVNRTLQRSRETGIVDPKNGRVFIRDFNGLSVYAGFEPGYLRLRR